MRCLGRVYIKNIRRPFLFLFYFEQRHFFCQNGALRYFETVLKMSSQVCVLKNYVKFLFPERVTQVMVSEGAYID